MGHRALYDDIRTKVLRGTLPAGERLPSSRELAAQWGVARMTVVRAYRNLLDEGYIEARVGSGTYVAAIAPERLLTVRRRVAPRSPPAGAPAPPARGPGAFAPHTPALDLFPYALWARVVGRAARGLHGPALGYQDPQGLAALRSAVAQHWRATRGARTESDRVVVTAGAQNALDLIARALARPGDIAAVETPGYPYARRALRRAGLTVVDVPVDGDGLVVEALERLPRAPRLVYVTPAHQQPTGAALSMPRRLALLHYARRTGCFVIEDDYDSDFRYAGRPLPVLQSLDTHGRVVLISSFSKTLFPALRLGFVCAPGDGECQALVRRQDDALRFVAPLEQRALSFFMDEGHYARHLRSMRRRYAQRRESLRALLESPVAEPIRTALDLHWPHTGFSAVAWWRADRPARHDIGRAGAALGLELQAFATTRPPRQAILLGFGSTPAARMPEAVAALASLL